MARGTKVRNERVLQLALRWIGEGPHLPLLETILPRRGAPLVDPSECEYSLLQHWPEMFDFGWQCAGMTPDPFFIHVLSLFVNHDPEFGMTDELQRRIHVESLDSVLEYLNKAHTISLKLQRNFLGQTAIHIAVAQPIILAHLINHCEPEVLDCGDRDGTTALMYAAALNQQASIRLLMDGGADLWLGNTRGMMFADFAMCCEHFDVIAGVYKHLKNQDRVEEAQDVADWAAARYLRFTHLRSLDPYLDGFNLLLSLTPDLTWITSAGNTAMHFANRPELVQSMLDYGYKPVNARNKAGHSVAMAMAWLENGQTARALMAHDLDLDSKDNTGLTALNHALLAGQAHSYWCWSPENHHREWQKKFSVLFEYLLAGASLAPEDNCSCQCSLRGCSPLRQILARVYSHAGRLQNLIGIPWVIELFMLAEILQCNGIATMIMSLYRLQRFDELGLTHTCCLGQLSFFTRVYKSPLVIAPDLERGDWKPNKSRFESEDVHEIHSEQSEFVCSLQDDCNRFDDAYVAGDWTTHVVQILARRAEFMRRGMELARTSASISSWSRVEGPESPPPQSHRLELLEDLNPPVWIDRVKDEFIYAPWRMPEMSDNARRSKASSNASIRAFLDVNGSFVYGSKEEQQKFSRLSAIGERRRQLCDSLQQSCDDLQNLSNADLDWSLDIVCDDK